MAMIHLENCITASPEFVNPMKWSTLRFSCHLCPLLESKHPKTFSVCSMPFAIGPEASSVAFTPNGAVRLNLAGRYSTRGKVGVPRWPAERRRIPNTRVGILLRLRSWAWMLEVRWLVRLDGLTGINANQKLTRSFIGHFGSRHRAGKP